MSSPQLLGRRLRLGPQPLRLGTDALRRLLRRTDRLGRLRPQPLRLVRRLGPYALGLRRRLGPQPLRLRRRLRDQALHPLRGLGADPLGLARRLADQLVGLLGRVRPPLVGG
ncbi:hypothetical protein ABZ509_36665, partial [Streptomyces lavendulocolor]